MESEKVQVTATTNPYTNEVGGDSFDDSELQGRDGDSTPAEPSRRGMLEVRLLKPTTKMNVTKLTELSAEIHRLIHHYLLQHDHAGLMGKHGHHLPIRAAEWRPFGHGVRVHFCLFWSNCCGILHGGNGLHVRKAMSTIRPSLTSDRDPVVGAQYRWSYHFAPSAPRFWGLVQGT
jgi:hypothetical protein